MAQTWNDILGFIKRRLGSFNLLEISDEDIIQGLKDDVLPFYSQYSPTKKFLIFDESNRIPLRPGQGQFTYKLPINQGEYIIDVLDAYPMQPEIVLDDFGFIVMESADMIDTVIANQYLDMAKYMRVRNTWEFFPPDKISFDLQVEKCVIVYNTVHDSLNTIQPDQYHTIFKPLCLAEVMTWLVALRSKYESINTPMGEVRINWQKLETDSQQMKSELVQKLELLPMDKFVEVSV